MAAANRYGADLPRTKDSLSGPHFGDFPILSLGLSDYPVVYLGARFGFPGQKIADDHDHLTFFFNFYRWRRIFIYGLTSQLFFYEVPPSPNWKKKKICSSSSEASLPLCVELPRGEGIKGIDLSDRLTHAAEQPSRRTSRVVRLFIISLGEKKCEYNRSFSYFFRAFFLFFLGLILRARAATTKVAFFPSFLLFSSSLFSLSLLSLFLPSLLLSSLSFHTAIQMIYFFFPRIMKVELLSRVKRQTLSFSRRFKAKAYFK